jgi:hypothetical protein
MPKGIAPPKRGYKVLTTEESVAQGDVNLRASGCDSVKAAEVIVSLRAAIG